MTARENPEMPPWAGKALSRLETDGIKKSWLPEQTEEGLGCGHYGCVFALPDEGVVLKVTSDPSEVLFIKKAMKIGEWPDGIVQYYALREIPFKYRTRRTFAIWREAAFSVGMPLRGFGRDATYEEKAARQFSTRLGQFKDHAALVKRAVDAARKKGPDRLHEYLERVDKLENWAWDAVSLEDAEGRIRSEKWMRYYPRLRSFRGAQRTAAAIRACWIIAEMMANEYMSDLVGGALDFYLGHGMLLADVHGNNVGQVNRDGYDQWVITDPGHAVDFRP